MKKLVIALGSIGALIALGVILLLSAQSPENIVLMATESKLTWIPAPITLFWIKHFARLAQPDEGAYPVTLLQFNLNGLDEQKTPEGRARVFEIADLILRRGHDINARDSEGLTSVHYTVVNRSPETLQFLIDHGADINKKSSKGLTPLAFARRYQSKLLHPEEKGTYEPVVHLLKSSGAHE